jgi:hypothetical protein
MDRSRYLPSAVKRLDEVITRIGYEGYLVHDHPL